MKQAEELVVSVMPKGQIDEILKTLEIIARDLQDLKNKHQSKTPEDLLTKKETAEVLRVSSSSVYLWTKKGKLKAYGIQGRVYYKRAEVEAALTEL